MQYKPVWKKYLLALCFIFSAAAAYAQSKRAHGLAFSTNAVYNEQTNLNNVLNRNGLPNSQSFLFGFTVSRMFRYKNFEVSPEFSLLGNRRSRQSVDYDQATSLLALQTRYLFGNNKNEWYPTVGIGFANSIQRISQDNSSRDINAALTTARNTTTLYNRQGFVGLGLGYRHYAQQTGFFALEAGYHLGFEATPWSTRNRGNYMNNSVTDELGQFYIRLTSGFYNKRRER